MSLRSVTGLGSQQRILKKALSGWGREKDRKKVQQNIKKISPNWAKKGIT